MLTYRREKTGSLLVAGACSWTRNAEGDVQQRTDWMASTEIKETRKVSAFRC
jgi:hypothetical protein